MSIIKCLKFDKLKGARALVLEYFSYDTYIHYVIT